MKLYKYAVGYGGINYRLVVLAYGRLSADAMVIAEIGHPRVLTDGYDLEVTEVALDAPGLVLSTGWQDH